MKDSLGNDLAALTATGGQFAGDTAGATAYLLDKNPSSALKRYTNMAVCWGCHTSSHADQFKNSGSYWGNSQAPAGLTDSKTPTELGQNGSTDVSGNGTSVYPRP